jgi:capsular polysaccharide biosynthesis protein
MTLAEFKRILKRNKWKLIIIPLVTAITIYVLGKNFSDKKYTSNTTLFTGITSSYKIAGDNNAIDNQLYGTNALGDFISLLNSRGIKEEVALRLLSKHLMLADPDPKYLNKENFKFLEKKIPFNARQDLVAPTYDETLVRVRKNYQTDQKGIVYQLVNSQKFHSIYSIDALSKIMAGQIGNSELVNVEYSTSDPAVCYQTLELLNEVFIEKHDALFNQSKTVIAYYDSTRAASANRLHLAEQKLQEFSSANKIADYTQQINSSTSDKSSSGEKYNDLQVQYAGAVSSLQAIEQQLKNKGITSVESAAVIQAKDDVSSLTKQLTDLEMYGPQNADNTAKINRLRQQIADKTNNVKDATTRLYNTTHSAEGLPIAELLDQYSKQKVLVAQLRSQLNTSQGQNATVLRDYTKLVPVGVQLRSLQREVELAEKDYEAQVEGLKQSKLTQENSELLATHFKILDPPNFPGEPNSTLPILVVAGLLAAFIFTAGWLVAAEMLDTSMKNPDVAEKVTNFKVLGLLPELDSKNPAHALEDKVAEDEMARQLLLRFYKKDSAKLPFVVGVLSSYTGEGKSLIASSLAANLNNLGVKAIAMLPKDQQPKDSRVEVTKVVENVHLGSNEVAYNPPSGISKHSVAEVTGTKFFDYSVILVEFPAILEKPYPVSLLQHLNFILLTVKANRSWQKPDVSVYQNISKITDAPIELVLNGVRRDCLQDFIGKPLNS